MLKSMQLLLQEFHYFHIDWFSLLSYKLKNILAKKVGWRNREHGMSGAQVLADVSALCVLFIYSKVDGTKFSSFMEMFVMICPSVPYLIVPWDFFAHPIIWRYEKYEQIYSVECVQCAFFTHSLIYHGYIASTTTYGNKRASRVMYESNNR